MKTLIIVIDLSGGVGRVVSEVKKGLREKGHSVNVIQRGESFSNIWVIKEEVRDKYDIIYTQDWSCALGFLFSKKNTTCFHGNNPGIGYYIQTLVGKLLGKRLIVVGPSLKKRFPKSTMIYNGVNTKEFYDMGLKRRYFGWIDKKTEIYNEEEMKLIAKDYNLNLMVAKDIPKNKMNEFYNKCMVFASYPPESGAFNLAWLEAKASGVPTILGNENGIGIHNIDNLKKFTWDSHINKLLEVFQR